MHHHKKLSELKEQRLQELLDSCQQQVISQIIGPFGLSPLMFQDRNGGNVTTLHNFERDDNGYIAEKDKSSHEKSKEKYNRENYTDPNFQERSREKREASYDEYTGKIEKPTNLDVDHITSLKDIHQNQKSHLAFETGKGNEKITKVANSDENLATTHKSINRSKGSENLGTFCEKKGSKYDLDPKLTKEKQRQSEDFIKKTTDHELLKKQSVELLQTSTSQAGMMALRVGMGTLLTELINGLFNESKILFTKGVDNNDRIMEEVSDRLSRVAKSVINKVPDAFSQALEGGVSGFASNLLTFLINTFMSTAKRFVTVIREGLLGLFKAFKMILFPPENMTKEQALQAGLKIFATVVTTSIGILLQEAVTAFISTIPVLIPVAEIISSVLIGTISGLISAFIAYQIDSLFDSFAVDESTLDELIANSKRQEFFCSELTKLSNSTLDNVNLYNQAIANYQNLGVVWGNAAQKKQATLVSLDGSNAAMDKASQSAQATLSSLERSAACTKQQIEKSLQMIRDIKSSQIEIDSFLNNRITKNAQ